MKKVVSLFLTLILIAQVFSSVVIIASANDSSTAKMINTNTTYNDCLTRKEQFMWYKFRLENQSYICLSFVHDFIHTDFSDDVSWYVEIYNSEMDSIEEIEVLGRKTDVKSAEIGLPKGTYYVQVRWGLDCFDVAYSLKIAANASTVWETEFNDSGSTADEIKLNKTYNASLTYQNQRDWFTFKSNKTQYISLTFIHNLVDTTDYVWDVTIYDEQYNELEFYKIKGRVEKTKTEKLKISKGTYYVVVKLGDDWKYALNQTYKLNVSEYLVQPTLKTISNTTSGVKVSWGEVSGASSYRVYRKTSSSGWTCLNSKVTSTSYTDITAKSGTTYYYTVRAENEAGLSGYNSTGVSVKYLAMPTVTIANAATGVKVSWDKISGASKYYVYRKASGENSWTRLTTSATGTSYTDTKAKSGTTYYYTVKAVSGSVASASKSSSALKYLAQPAVTVSNANSGITVKWGKITGASGYYVYRKTSSGSWSLIYTVNSGSTVSYTDKSAKAGTTYYYTVRAYSGSVKSTYTSSTAIRRLTTPTLKSVSSATSGITFKWNKVTGASGYYVYRKTGSGGWQKIDTVKSGSTVSYLDKTAKKGTTYTYTVRAYYSSSISYFNTTGLKIKDKY